MYIGRTLEQLSVDVCGISEHWLYLNDLHFLESISTSYKYAAVSDSDLERPSRRKVGKGGVVIFWKRTKDSRVSVLNIDDDHIIGIQFQISKDNFFLHTSIIKIEKFRYFSGGRQIFLTYLYHKDRKIPVF